MYCKSCSTSQLDFTVPKEEMFIEHTYLSGTTKTLEKHFLTVAETVFLRFLKDKLSPKVLDIGSNDGTQLEQYRKLGCEILGVESAIYVSEIANKNGIPTLNTFFNLESAKLIQSEFDVINAAGVFFHLEELHSVCQGIKFLLVEDGVFVVQFIYMKLMQENVAFDQIYHEHLLYYTLHTIQELLKRHDLEMFDAEISEIHGGSIIGFVGHSGKRPFSHRLELLIEDEKRAKTNSVDTYREFAKNVYKSKARTLHWVQKSLNEGKTIYGLGAPVKGNTLLNFFGLGPQEIRYLTERNPLRKGLVSPGMHIPVIMDDELPVNPDKYLVLAWNFKSEILARHQNDIDNGIEFFFPVETGLIE
jgi:SAM-dependent methyltransferase